MPGVGTRSVATCPWMEAAAEAPDWRTAHLQGEPATGGGESRTQGLDTSPLDHYCAWGGHGGPPNARWGEPGAGRQEVEGTEVTGRIFGPDRLGAAGAHGGRPGRGARRMEAWAPGQRSAHQPSWVRGRPRPGPSGMHFDAEVFAELLQEHKREHRVRHKADACRQEALGTGKQEQEVRGAPGAAPARPTALAPPTAHLVKGQRPQLCSLYCAVENTLQKTKN